MKKIFTMVLSGLLSAAMLASCGGNPGGGNNSTGGDDKTAEGGEILAWQHIESQAVSMKEEFERVFPEYTVNFEITNNQEMLKKFQTTLASGGQVPDALFLDLMDGGSVVCSDKAKDLFIDMTADPYNLDKDSLVGWVGDLYSDASGAVRGIEIGPAPSTFAVRKSMAEKYLGTTDPDEISEKLKTWDDVVELGRKIKQEGGGKEFLAANLNELVGILKQESKGLFDGTTCNMKSQWTEQFGILNTLASEDLIDTLEADGPEIPAALESDSYFMWQCAMWQPMWTFMASAPESAGQWILMSTPPGGKMFVGGGMPLCVPKDAKNPMGGFKYITYFRCTMDGVAFSRDNFGDVADIKEAYEDPAFHTTPQDMRDYFQCDVLEQYAKYIENTEVLELTPYDKTLWSDGVKIAFQALENGDGADQAMQAYVDELKRVYPEITE